MMVTPPAPGAFSRYHAELSQLLGPEAAGVRHEAYFTGVRRGLVGPRLRALLATLRDLVWLARPMPPHGHAPRGEAVILLVTLSGSAGWGTLERALPSIHAAGKTPVLLVHPRLSRDDLPRDLPVLRPARAPLSGYWAAVRALARGLRRGCPLVVGLCLARRALWRSSLARTLAGIPGPLLLHNDFDMASSAACSLGRTTLCLQHGLPTDEFFPLQADWHLVWGSAAQAAYRQQASPAQRILAGAPCPPVSLAEPARTAPCAVAIVSQGHATVFAPTLGVYLKALARELAGQGVAVRWLWHPRERAEAPAAPGIRASHPPHTLLRDTRDGVHLVLGYCSTALIEAAQAGHWVARLDPPLAGNETARRLLSGLPGASTSEDAKALLQRLQEDPAFRDDTARATRQWLRDLFDGSPDALERLLRQGPEVTAA